MLPIDVEGPVTAEVFTLAMTDLGPLLTGPCGPAPWLIEAGHGEHPIDTVRRLAGSAMPGLRLLHSTSWRFERGAVVLSFLVVMDESRIGEFETVPVHRVDLARSTATEAPPAIGYEQVLEHALRHLAWLAKEDEAVRVALDDRWHDLLEGYVPEPFLQLGG